MRVALALLVVLLAAWLVWSSRADDVGSLPPAAAAAESPQSERAVPATSDSFVHGDGDATDEFEREAAPIPSTTDLATSTKAPFVQIVRGRVLLANGAPAPRAGVRAGSQAATAADDGTFTLEVRSPDDDLAAWLTGHEPALLADVARHPDVIADRVLDVLLPGPALTIDGWLFGPDGKPAKGWRLHLHGGAIPVDDSVLPTLSAEDFAAGANHREDPQLRWRRATNPNERGVGNDGAFTFGGLRRNCDYVLRAWNQHTLQTAVSPPIRAGTRGYTFVVPIGSFREHVSGRTIDRHGGPIAGVRVRLTMRVHKRGNSESYETGQSTSTDADGRFRFTNVIHEDLLLRFDGDDVATLYHEFRATDAGNDVLVRLGTQCRFRFEPSTIVPAVVRVRDAQGKSLRLSRQLGSEPGRSEGGSSFEWKAGDEAREITVGDEAVWLVLEQNGREVQRIALHLARGTTTVVR